MFPFIYRLLRSELKSVLCGLVANSGLSKLIRGQRLASLGPGGAFWASGSVSLLSGTWLTFLTRLCITS